jgi:predicted ATPase with chaperone activity
MNTAAQNVAPLGSVPGSRPSRPPVPETLRDTGISEEAIQDLLLKVLYVQGARTGQQVSDSLCLSFTLVDDLLLGLQQRQFVGVRSTGGHGRAGSIFDITAAGRERAREAFESSQYIGPVPVPLADYRGWMEAQSIRNVQVTRSRLQEGFRHMVIEPAFLELLGPAINSAKSLFLYGDPGNGKSLIAESIASIMGGSIFLPHAIEVDGQVIVLYDPVYHKPALSDEEPISGVSSIWRQTGEEYDRRFVRVRRPVVVAGGELTLDQLDLQYDPFTKVYQAPFQLKASGGVLIIDDFGRQRTPARDLLNRWIVPLDKRIDYLTMHTGSKFPVAFDCLLIFATNIEPRELVDESFLRRIHYKVHVLDPTPIQYAEIFRRCCEARGIAFQPAAVEYVYREYYERRGIPARACHPRDIADHLCDAARFLEQPPALTQELIESACSTYFLDVAPTG